MKRADKIRALEEAIKGNLKPLQNKGLEPILSFVFVHNGEREILSINPTATPEQVAQIKNSIHEKNRKAESIKHVF